MEKPDGLFGPSTGQKPQPNMDPDATVQEKATVDTTAAPNTEFKPTTAFVLAFISICVITLAAALDATSLSIALPIITEKLKGSAIEAFWSGTSFLLTSAVFQPVIAGLSHVFGRKASLMGSGLLFGLGSILAAVAQNFTLLYVYNMISSFQLLTMSQTGWQIDTRNWWGRNPDIGRDYRHRSRTTFRERRILWIHRYD
jgi:hypothetical protein